MQQSTLPRPALAHNGDLLAGSDIEIDPAKNGYLDLARAIDLRQLFDAYYRVGGQATV